MKRIIAAVGLLVILMMHYAPAHAYWVKLGMLAETCAAFDKDKFAKGACTGYIAGVVDSLTAAKLICTPEGLEIGTIVRPYAIAFQNSTLQEAAKETSAFDFVAVTLTERYPCKETKRNDYRDGKPNAGNWS